MAASLAARLHLQSDIALIGSYGLPSRLHASHTNEPNMDEVVWFKSLLFSMLVTQDNGQPCGAVGKTNQDRGCITCPFMGSPTSALLCVFDGKP